MCHLLLALPLVALPVFWLFPLTAAIPVYAVVVAISATVYWYAVRAMKQPLQNGLRGMIGDVGRVVEITDGGMRIQLHGEYWRASSRDATLREGDRVEIIGAKTEMLAVQRLGPDSPACFGSYPARPGDDQEPSRLR